MVPHLTSGTSNVRLSESDDGCTMDSGTWVQGLGTPRLACVCVCVCMPGAPQLWRMGRTLSGSDELGY